MSYEDIAKIGCRTERIAATSTSSSKTIPVQSKNIIVNVVGSSPAFVTSGAAGLSIVYPTTTTGQNGSIIQGGQTQTFKRNNPTDTTFYAICDTGLTADVLVTFVDGE